MITTGLPEDFIRQMTTLLGCEAEALFTALNEEPPISVRLNKRKSGAVFENATGVPWCASGIYIPQRPEFILDPLLHAGAYYVQDASSMIYEPLTQTICKTLNEEASFSHLRVLDLCAAPGGKTTAMINGLPDNCAVTANEYSQKRVGALKENIAKWGYPDVNVTNQTSEFYGRQGYNYDIIAVDAPCSGEGMMRKDEFARKQWSPALVDQCATLQREILENATKALKPGGFLIYSTCTFNTTENEGNAEFLVSRLGLSPFNPEFPDEWGLRGGINTDLPVIRFMPHITKGEGLFVSVFRKPGEWNPTPQKNLNIKKTVKTKELAIPSIEEILSVGFTSHLPFVDLDKNDALTYLKRETISPPPNTPKGEVILRYKGLNLGLGKNIGTRINNLYPKTWRILKR